MAKDLEFIVSLVERIEVKIDKIQETQIEQGQVLARNTIIVDQHEARSTKLEDWVSKVSASVTHLEADVKTVKDTNTKVVKHIDTINKFLTPLKSVVPIIKFILLLSTLVGVIYTAFSFFKGL
jgi:maltodextrin utilization protein YvdJ